MKFLLALIFLSSTVHASSARIVQGDVLEGFTNVLLNPSFDQSTFNKSWTTTTASSAVETTTVVAGAGKQSAKVTFSSSTGDIAQTVSPSGKMTGQIWEASCKVNTTLTTIQVCGIVNSVEQLCVNASSSGNFAPVTATINPVDGQNVGVRVKTSSSTTGSFYADDCYVGPARNVGTSQTFTDTTTTLALTPSAGFGTVTGVVSSTAKMGDKLDVQIYWVNGTVAASTAFITLPTGYTIDTAKLGASPMIVGVGSLGITGAARGIWSNNDAMIVFYDGSTNNQLFITNFDGASTFTKQNGSTIEGNTQINSFHFSVPISGWTAQNVYKPDQTPASWSGYQNGFTGSTSVCDTTSATYADPTACTSIATVQTTSRNIICTQNSTLPSITCTLPRAGIYHIEAYPNLVTSTAATMSARLVDGSAVVIDPGHSLVLATGASSAPSTLPLAGDYSAVAGSVSFKVQLATNGGTANLALGQAATSAAIQWIITEKDAPLAMPYLTGSVTSTTTGQDRSERARMGASGGTDAAPTACTSSPCTVYSQSGFVSTLTRSGTGDYVLTYVAGTFSGLPVCQCNDIAASGTGVTCDQINTTTSSTELIVSNISGGARIDEPLGIHCQGPR